MFQRSHFIVPPAALKFVHVYYPDLQMIIRNLSSSRARFCCSGSRPSEAFWTHCSSWWRKTCRMLSGRSVNTGGSSSGLETHKERGKMLKMPGGGWLMSKLVQIKSFIFRFMQQSCHCCVNKGDFKGYPVLGEKCMMDLGIRFLEKTACALMLLIWEPERAELKRCSERISGKAEQMWQLQREARTKKEGRQENERRQRRKKAKRG